MVICVMFRNNGKLYDYYCDFPVKKGDLVVVPTGSIPFKDFAKDFAVVKVMGEKRQSDKAKLWAVSKVDVQGFNARMQELEMLT